MTDFASNLLVHLPLNESAGNPVDWADGTSPVKAGGATYVAGKTGNAIQLDGIDGNVYLPENEVINGISTEITVAMWIYPTAWPNAFITLASKQGFGSGGKYPSWDFRKGSSGDGSANTITIYLVCDEDGAAADYSAVSAGSISTGQWTHVAFTYDSVNLKIYINGVQSGSSVPTSGWPIYYSDTNIAIGTNPSFPAGRYFTGKIDDVRIYDRALSVDDLAALVDYSPTAPSIAGGATQNVSYAENHVPSELADIVPSGEPFPTMSITGGADIGLFTLLVDDPIQLVIDESGNPGFVFDYENPADANSDNVYVAIVRAESYMGVYDQTINITITAATASGKASTTLLLLQ